MLVKPRTSVRHRTVPPGSQGKLIMHKLGLILAPLIGSRGMGAT